MLLRIKVYDDFVAWTAQVTINFCQLTPIIGARGRDPRNI